MQALATAPARLREDRLLVLAAVQVGRSRVYGVYGFGLGVYALGVLSSRAVKASCFYRRRGVSSRWSIYTLVLNAGVCDGFPLGDLCVG